MHSRWNRLWQEKQKKMTNSLGASLSHQGNVQNRKPWSMSWGLSTLDWEKEQDSSVKEGLFMEQGSLPAKEKKHLCSSRMALTVRFQGESLDCPVKWPSVIVPPFLYLSSADKYKWSYLQEIWTEIPVLYKQWVKMETGGVANEEVFQAVIWNAWQVGYKQLFPINSNHRKTQISRRKNEIISTFEILFNISISLWGWALCSRPLHRKGRHCCQVLLQGLVHAGLQLVLRKTSPFPSTGLIPQVPATHSNSFPNNAATGQLGELSSLTIKIKLPTSPGWWKEPTVVKRRPVFHKIGKSVCPILQLHRFSERGAMK